MIVNDWRSVWCARRVNLVLGLDQFHCTFLALFLLFLPYSLQIRCSKDSGGWTLCAWSWSYTNKYFDPLHSNRSLASISHGPLESLYRCIGSAWCLLLKVLPVLNLLTSLAMSSFILGQYMRFWARGCVFLTPWWQWSCNGGHSLLDGATEGEVLSSATTWAQCCY